MAQKNTALGFNFDANSVAPQAAMEAVPGGWYSVAITDGETTVNDGGNGRRLAFEFTVLEGPFKGRKIFDGLNVVHSNPQAQQIAQGQLSAICHATGVFNVSDVSQLFNKPFQIKVDVEAARTVNEAGESTDAAGNPLTPGTPGTKTYEAKNRFKGAKAGSAPAASPVAKSAAGAPAWAAGAPAPAAVAPAPVAAASAAAKPRGKPGPKAKPAATAAPVAPEKKYYVGIDGPAFVDALPASKVAEYLAQGMPSDTPLCPEGSDEYFPASTFNLTRPPIIPAAAFVPPAGPAPALAAPAPAPALASAGAPPWAQ